MLSSVLEGHSSHSGALCEKKNLHYSISHYQTRSKACFVNYDQITSRESQEECPYTEEEATAISIAQYLSKNRRKTQFNHLSLKISILLNHIEAVGL